MASLKQAILSIMAHLESTIPYIRIWNGQVKEEEDGKLYDFPKPALFIEARSSNQFQPLGGGFSQSDITFIFHLVHEQFDAQDGTFEQNLAVYDLKSSVNALLTNFKPEQCSGLMKTGESQDYNHTNIYHYQLEYICGLIDTDGVPIDTLSGSPITLETDTTWQDQ